MPEISINPRREKLGYRINADDTFWIKQGIINSSQLRDSIDEQLIADIILSILLKEPFAASKETLDLYYGKDDDTSKLNEVETNLLTYGFENLINDIKVTYSTIKDLTENPIFGKNSLKKILNPNAGGNPVKEPYYTLFMAFYELLIRKHMEINDINGIIGDITDLAKDTKSASHYVKSEDRQKNIDTCLGRIQRFFKISDNISYSPGTLSIDFENDLKLSVLEAPNFEFKQGFYNLEDKNRKLEQSTINKVVETICAIANMGKNKGGTIYIGISDKEADTKRIEKLDNLSNVPRIGDYGIVGLEREAIISNLTIEKYILKFTQKISTDEIPDWLKRQVNADIKPIHYKGRTILQLTVKSGNEPAWYKGNLFIRDGASNKEVQGAEINAVFQLFK